MKIIKEATGALFNRGRSLYIFLCVIVLLNILPIPFLGMGTGYSEPHFSIISNNEPLYNALAKISKSTGYKIEITKGWKDRSLTANLKKFALGEGIREIIRIIGEPSCSIVIDDSMKKVEIRIFDASSQGEKEIKGVDVITKADFHDEKNLPPEVEMGNDIAEREKMEREMQMQMQKDIVERERMEREMEMERRHEAPRNWR